MSMVDVKEEGTRLHMALEANIRSLDFILSTMGSHCGSQAGGVTD